MCAAFRSHRKSANSSGSRSRPSARQFNRDVRTLDEAATPYERGPHCASQQIKLSNVPFGSDTVIRRRRLNVRFAGKRTRLKRFTSTRPNKRDRSSLTVGRSPASPASRIYDFKPVPAVPYESHMLEPPEDNG